MTRLTTATAIGLVLASTPAMAEITPMSVWEQLSTYYSSMGFTVETESVEEAGDTVTVRGLTLKQEVPTSTTDGDLGDVVFTATGDGGVSVDMADEMSLLVVADAPSGTASTQTEPNAPAAEPAKTSVAISMRMPGESITVHEEGAGNRYDYSIPSVELTIDRIEGADGNVVENPAKLTMTDLAGSDLIESGDLLKLVQAGTAASMVIDFDFADPAEQNNQAKGTVTLNDIAIESTATVPAGTDMGANMSAALAAGLDVAGTMTFGKIDLNVEFGSVDADGAAQSGSATSTSEGGELAFLLSDGRIGYSGTSGATQVEAKISAFPMPISYGLESGVFDIEFPVTPNAEPQPFKFVYGFDGLTMSDSIWGLFDPQSLLPRDPAKMAFDLAGTMTLDADIFDPEAMESAVAAPGEFNTLTVNNAQISALGADVSVTGELTSPEGGNLVTPIGTLTGRLTGVNALLDKLGQAGLLPQEQAMGVRMMMAMFTTADPQDANALTSEIEFREGGQIFANGQQVK